MPPLSRTTSISRLRPISVLLCRSCASSKVHLDRTAVEFLIDKGYDPTYGARPMRRAVEKYLEVHAAGENLALRVALAATR
jgi:ATP-dependent Clp protease ATP-binding subunit ClpA